MTDCRLDGRLFSPFVCDVDGSNDAGDADGEDEDDDDDDDDEGADDVDGFGDFWQAKRITLVALLEHGLMKHSSLELHGEKIQTLKN